MECEVCGKETHKIVVARIEGAVLKVCPNCAKAGVVIAEREEKPAAKSPGAEALVKGLERRSRRMSEKDIFSENDTILVMDYGDRVRNARNKMGLTRTDLARKINEKESVLAEVERNELIPDDKLISKLEHALKITLREKAGGDVGSKHLAEKDGGGGGLTLGDLIKMQEK